MVYCYNYFYPVHWNGFVIKRYTMNNSIYRIKIRDQKITDTMKFNITKIYSIPFYSQSINSIISKAVFNKSKFTSLIRLNRWDVWEKVLLQYLASLDVQVIADENFSAHAKLFSVNRKRYEVSNQEWIDISVNLAYENCIHPM